VRQLIEDAKKLISIPSVTTEGNESITNHVAGLMRARGLKVSPQQVSHSFESVSKRQFNVIGIFGDPLVDKKTRKGLLLVTHLDTVGPGRPENWSQTGGQPFSPSVKEGRVYGLGAADVKLDFLCKLRALEKFREQKLKMPIYLVGTCGAEMGMFGTKYLIKSLALNPKYVLVSEPTQLEVIHTHKHQAIFKVTIGYSRVSKDAKGFNRRARLTALGISAHGATPDSGVNAILRLLEFIRQAQEAGFDLRITGCSGGDFVNKVPDFSTAEVFLTSHQLEDFKRFFSDYCDSAGVKDAFQVEFGGLGEAGVQFLPEQVFQAICDSVGYFGQLAAEISEEKDARFDPPHSSINFGLIRESAGAVELLFDLRLLPAVKGDELEQKIRSAFQQLGSHYPGLNLTVQRDRTNPGLSLGPDAELSRICVGAAREAALSSASVGPGALSASTEAAQFSQAGYEAVAFGPGRLSSGSHAPNEWIDLESLEKAVRFYEKVIEKTCI
jgi:acetylornithine deacetylase/succinyl-diaminopimelate desuccinylase-like protein